MFNTSSNTKYISQVQKKLIRKPSILSSRNHERFIRLYKKYNLLLNITAFRTNYLSDKTMIYSCESFCGGWGDRLRGIMSVYILALLSNRHFMIDMNYPCDVLKVLQPNYVNWTYVRHDKTKNRTRLTINTMRSWQTSNVGAIANTIKAKNFVKIWSQYDDIYISTNSDYMTPAIRNIYMQNKTQHLLGRIAISQATMQTLFDLLFELLFKPSFIIHNRVDTILTKAHRRHLICLHIRVGKNPTNPFDHAFTARANTTKAMIDFTDKYMLNRTSPIIFVTSDSGQAISEVLQHYRDSSMTIVGPILHIDRFDRRSTTLCEGFIKVIADFYLLGECQTLVVSSSGFSSWANRRRERPQEELYIFNEKLRAIRKS